MSVFLSLWNGIEVTMEEIDNEQLTIDNAQARTNADSL